jgi:secreted trypsin-like serine protease
MAMSDAQLHALVKKAAARAEAMAGDDDAAFVRELRAAFFQGRRPGLRELRVLRTALRASGDRSAHIFEDPRYLRNARELARKTRRNLRVLGGSNVKAKQFLDCVAVGNDRQWGCTGTLIAPDVVLTAGHCADFATRVFVGNDVSQKGRVYPVRRRIRHPKYNKGKRNDLLVLLLETSVENVPPRKIAKGAIIDGAADGRVVGFGATDPDGMFGYGRKRQTDVPIASPSCEGAVNGEEDRFAYGCDPDLELIAGKPLLERDTCSGDSGGPLYVAGPSGAWLLAGATSRATDSAVNVCGDGGVYVRVDRYRKWILSIPGVQLA